VEEETSSSEEEEDEEEEEAPSSSEEEDSSNSDDEAEKEVVVVEDSEDDDDDDDDCDYLGSRCPLDDDCREDEKRKCGTCEKMSRYFGECECCNAEVCSACHEHNTHDAGGVHTAYCERCMWECDPENDEFWHGEEDAGAGASPEAEPPCTRRGKEEAQASLR